MSYELSTSLSDQGIATKAAIHANLGTAALVEHAVAKDEGKLTRDGALLVDTGAAAIVLRSADARVLGLNPESLDYGIAIRTASGMAQAAEITLSSVTVAGVEMRDVAALVVQGDLPHSLLGMSFLGRLSGFEATPEGLLLRP